MLTRICVHKCYFPRLFPRPLGGNGGERCKIWNQWSWIDSRKWVPCYKSRGRQKSGPLKSAHTYLKTCEYGTFHGKKDTANISKLRILRWGVYPGLPGAGGHNKQVSKEREEGKSRSEKQINNGSRGQRKEKMVRCCLWKWKGQQAKECTQPLESGKDKAVIVHHSLQKESVLLTSWFSCHWDNRFSKLLWQTCGNLLQQQQEINTDIILQFKERQFTFHKEPLPSACFQCIVMTKMALAIFLPDLPFLRAFTLEMLPSLG